MNDTQTLIIRGCKFIFNLGAERWNSVLNRKAITRMRDLCQLQIDEWEGTTPVEELATPEVAERIFNENQR